MIILPESDSERRSKQFIVCSLFLVIFSYFAFQVFSSVSSSCEKQMQNVRQSTCDESGLCLVTTEQGQTFTAKNISPDELVPVEVCKASI